MKIFIVLAFAFVIMIGLGLIFVPPMVLSNSYAVDETGQSTPRSRTIPGEYIVTLKPEAVGEAPNGDQGLSNHSLKKQEQNIFITAAGAEELIEDQGGNVTKIYDRVINGFAVEGVSDVTPLIQDPAIETVEPNWKDFPQKQYVPDALDRIDLDRAVTASSRPDGRESRPNIDVAIVDEPVAPNHPDLNVVERKNFVANCGTEATCPPGGGNHGTHTSGSVAAKDNLGGIVGGIPGARIHGFASCGTGPDDGCSGDAALAAWESMISTGGIEIANMSVGCRGTPTACAVSSTVQTAGTNLVNAGVTMFVSAGNDNNDVTNYRYCGVDAFICVSALADTNGKCGGGGPDRHNSASWGWSHDDQKASFSAYGSDVDIMAPGVNVVSTFPGTTSIDDPTTGATTSTGGATTGTQVYIGTSEQGKYGVSSGTSMASPIAAGIGGLIKSKNPSWTPSQIKADMQAKAYAQTLACNGFGKGGLVSGANSESSEKILYAGDY